MNDKELTEAIVTKYKDVYFDWPNPKVTEIVHNAFDGTLVAVRATDTSGKGLGGDLPRHTRRQDYHILNHRGACSLP